MPSIKDWASKAAERCATTLVIDAPRQERIDRAAAIIATFAEPLVSLLREAKREHYSCEDTWYCCGKCTCSCVSGEKDHEHDESCYHASHIGSGPAGISHPDERASGVCNCGADAWNARIDAVLAGK